MFTLIWNPDIPPDPDEPRPDDQRAVGCKSYTVSADTLAINLTGANGKTAAYSRVVVMDDHSLKAVPVKVIDAAGNTIETIGG
jgi:hypothetical protein